ncbi:hypothetical protein BEL04_23375 [Mucilaginibacter sp. PPCGB 2223]|nr:hypothetical protein BEL04_23375 [Mucilaginibacter sp. PPCGB 2223]
MDGSVDVWRIAISKNILAVNDMQALLSDDEHQRATRYYQQTDRERFIISRGALRMLLGRYLNTHARAIVFEIGADKKPFVKNGARRDIHYNTAHSGDYILIAIAKEPVGVDVECLEPMFPYQDILRHSFGHDEINCIAGSTDPLKIFYTLWTRKEALLKATGKGIDDDMKHIPCTDGRHSVANSLIRSDNNWLITSFDVDKNYVGALAFGRPGVNFRDLELAINHTGKP